MNMLYDLVAGIISMIAKSLGVSYATANVAWNLYRRDWCVSYPASCFSFP